MGVLKAKYIQWTQKYIQSEIHLVLVTSLKSRGLDKHISWDLATDEVLFSSQYK